MIVWFPDSAQLTCPTHACGNSIHIFVFVSSVLLRLSLATPSRDYSSRAARLGFLVVCLCRASEHKSLQSRSNHALQHLCAVLDTLWKNQLKAKPSKCKFLKSELLFLGHTISAQGIKPNSAKNALQRIVTTPYHPQANGCVEQLNSSLVQLIAKLLQEHPNTAWTEHLPTALLILQARIN
ncbi:hypothetical protein DSO57_1032864 [Entomophthora muscae]|uniref:Uncharacterized protein n=1 Tax=Entomophthora muscae TaxID=34485 RepID=A0ACC2T053_9FUNG|nr:hypothetical protein DSO57_1032864 [Entomophthora muscae]